VDTTPEVAREQEVPLEANLEKIEPNPGETEAVMERQETSNEEVAINSPRACQDERTTCQETMEACLEGKEEPASVELKPEVADEEVPLEDVVVMRQDQRHLAAQRRQKKEEELTETVETTHWEREEPTSADMKECQETTVCHEATEADIGKMEPFDRMIAILKQMIAMTETNQEMIATTDLNGKTEKMECEQQASVDMTPEVAQQEVPREDAAVMPVRGLRKQRRGRKQAAGRCKEPEKLNQGICGSREKLAAACRKVSRHATVAWRRRDILRKSWKRSCGLRREVTAAGIKETRGYCGPQKRSRDPYTSQYYSCTLYLLFDGYLYLRVLCPVW
jgi:hypothetical protein